MTISKCFSFFQLPIEGVNPRHSYGQWVEFYQQSADRLQYVLQHKFERLHLHSMPCRIRRRSLWSVRIKWDKSKTCSNDFNPSDATTDFTEPRLSQDRSVCRVPAKVDLVMWKPGTASLACKKMWLQILKFRNQIFEGTTLNQIWFNSLNQGGGVVPGGGAGAAVNIFR